jgi:hypothetical protein
MDSSDDHFARRGACGTKPAIDVEALNFTNPKARQVQADFTGGMDGSDGGLLLAREDHAAWPVFLCPANATDSLDTQGPILFSGLPCPDL